MYVISGEMRVTFEDETEARVYSPGDLLFIPSAIPHLIEITPASGATLLGIHFDFYDEFELTPDIYMVVDEEKANPESICSLPINANGEPILARRYAAVPVEIITRMEFICEEFTACRPGFEMACNGAMMLILSALLRLQPMPDRTLPSPYHYKLNDLIDDMNNGLHLPWTIATMAQRLSVSEDHFIRLFKETYGMTPNRYLQHLRHQEAKRGLRETDLKIETIGMRVGYDSLHHFSHIFKKWQGVSPREYRKMNNIL
jgi:AraC-like DNA-binding protein